MRRLSGCLLMMLALPAAGASAATLRSMTLLHAPFVRLSDLFDNAGENANRVLGTAPDPGGRIVVEAPQLAAIARQFDVDWRPASSADRAVLERPGRSLPREDVLRAVKTALIAAGASPDCAVELPGFTAPLVPAEARPEPMASDVDYDAASGRFTAMLAITGPGMEPLNLRIAGQADTTIDLPVAVSRLPAGTVMRPDDVRMARVHVATLHMEVMHAAADVVGMQLRHPVIPGQPFAVGNLTRPDLVERGNAVEMQVQAPGMTLLAQGVAMDSGATGERIRVLNPSSRAVVEAEVIGPGRVRVMPDSIPLSVASRSNQGLTQ